MAPALQTIEETFHAALECNPDQLSVFLDTRCAGDEALRTKVEALLASHRKAETSVEISISAVAANIIGNGQPDSLIGETIGHYRILKRIGAGGMGEVYLASDVNVGRTAALKLLPAYLSGNEERLRRFEQEARAVAGLNHPNIMTIYEVGAHDSVRYIASELIEGETLHQRLACGRLEVKEAIEIGIQVASALAAAHSAGVVHRDIKPENIMLRPDGYVKVLDFGIAKLAEREPPPTVTEAEALSFVETNVGAILGTVSYMSPEQARGAPVNKRTDIWSLGVVAYEMTTGHAPFSGDTPREVMSSIVEKEPPPLKHVPPELQQILTKALRKNPEERFQSANEMLAALKHLRHKLELAAELKPSWVQSPVTVAVISLAALLGLALSLYWHRRPAVSSIPAKSIAVLPFDNLSQDKQDAYLADGIQDEILSDLASVADLKVISRTSVMQYKSGTSRNLRDIGRQLDVAQFVEGSVERSGNRVRVSANLTDAGSDRHLWAQTYDRDVSDLFSIQSEIAMAIVRELQAKLSPDAKKAIERAPTRDITAFDLYISARNLLIKGADTGTVLPPAIDLLNLAVTHDPSFFDAWCQLAGANDFMYFVGLDHTSARLALAEAALQAASRLRPDAGETHLARAAHLYLGYLDYEGALAELTAASQRLPNSPHVFELTGYIKRRQGKPDEALHNLEQAIRLDPRNVSILDQIAASYRGLRRYAEEEAAFDRILAIDPNDIATKLSRAWVEVQWKADTRPLHHLIDSIRKAKPNAGPVDIGETWVFCALAERDATAMQEAWNAAGSDRVGDGWATHFSRPFIEGIMAHTTGEDAKARAAFIAARTQQEKIVEAEPNYGPALCELGMIDAVLGRKEEALSEGRRAVELLPVQKDAGNGPSMIAYFAIIAAWVGDKDLACEQLAAAVRLPNGPSYGQLKLLPFWDPLRGDPGFEKIVASLAPKQ